MKKANRPQGRNILNFLFAVFAILFIVSCTEKKPDNTVALEKETDSSVATEEEYFFQNYITQTITPYLSQPEAVMNLRMKIPKS